MAKKPANKAERAHLLAIKHLACIVCKTAPPSQAHHICDTGRRLGHYFTLPLCESCHIGADGFTGKNRGAWDKSLANQLKLLSEVYEKLHTEMPVYRTKVIKRKGHAE